MKKDINRIKPHILGIIFIITVGIFIPRLIQIKYQEIVQIMLVTALVYIYIIIIYDKKNSSHIQEIQNHQQNRMVESQKIMLELSNSMIQVKSFEELLSIILANAIEMIPTASQGSILVMNKDGLLEFKAILGFEEDLYNIKLDPEESYQWKATGGVFKGPIILENLQTYSTESMSEENYNAMNNIDALSINSTLSAPIMINNAFFGSINLDSKMNNMFNEEDIQIMTYFANQATIAIVNHQLYEEMHYFSRYDGLTRIYNRRYFEEIIEEHLNKKIQQNFAIVLIDLNEFKQINDLYGHRNGDLVLENFASFVSQAISTDDVFARFGGDEFVGMFNNKNYEWTEDKMSKMRQLSVTRLIELIDVDTSIVCGFSYGIALYPEDGVNLNELFHIADSRMYESKKAHHHRRRDDSN